MMETPILKDTTWDIIPHPEAPPTPGENIQTHDITINEFTSGLSALIKDIEAKPGAALSDFILVDKKFYKSLIEKEIRTIELSREFDRNQHSLIEELGWRDKEIDELRCKLEAATSKIKVYHDVMKINESGVGNGEKANEANLDVKVFTERLQHTMELDPAKEIKEALALGVENQDRECSLSSRPGDFVSSRGSLEPEHARSRGWKRRRGDNERDNDRSHGGYDRRCLASSLRASRDRGHRHDRSRSQYRDRSRHDSHRHKGSRHDGRSYDKGDCGSCYEERSVAVYEHHSKHDNGHHGRAITREDRMLEAGRGTTFPDHGERALDLTPWIQVSAVEQLMNRSRSDLRALFFILLHDSIEIDQALSRVLGGRVESIIWKENAIGSDRRTAFVNFVDHFEAESYLRFIQVNPEHLHGEHNSGRQPEISVQWATRSGLVKFYLASAIVANGATRLLRINGVPKSISYQDLWELAMRGDNTFRFIRQSATGVDSIDYTLEFASISEALAARSRLFRDDRLRKCGFLWATNKTDSAVELFTREQLGDGSLLRVNPVRYQ